MVLNDVIQLDDEFLPEILECHCTTSRRRVESGKTAYAFANELTIALQRAAAAHGEHEERIGHPDPNWPVWYAD
jgi:hypothetical protein